MSTSVSGSTLHPPEPLLVLGDGLTQVGDAEPRRILVLAGADRVDGGVEHLGRPVSVGETLAEVDGSGLGGEGGHAREDRGAERREA
jgi:hypothetical protein